MIHSKSIVLNKEVKQIVANIYKSLLLATNFKFKL